MNLAQTWLLLLVVVLSIDNFAAQPATEVVNEQPVSKDQDSKDLEKVIYLDETLIKANRELPKVLYILPWKTHQGQVITARQPILSNDSIMSPIYPNEYRREMLYRGMASAKPFEQPAEKKFSFTKLIFRTKSEDK
ncbi:MAG: hypothetical protein KUG79_13700 [Pseudomonadales bacterium]|nr:hypothetical protein [Pseudomonadales bacterium]